jgi:hypothetical protein
MELDTWKITELARVYSKTTTFKIHYLEYLDGFYKAVFTGDCYHEDHLRRLELPIWPSYWDLDIFPPDIANSYNPIAAEHIVMLHSQLNIQHKSADIKITANLRRECPVHIHVGDSRFNYGPEANMDIVLTLKKHSFEVELVQDAVDPGGSGLRRHVNALFEYPVQTWLGRIKAGQSCLSPQSYRLFAPVNSD